MIEPATSNRVGVADISDITYKDSNGIINIGDEPQDSLPKGINDMESVSEETLESTFDPNNPVSVKVEVLTEGDSEPEDLDMTDFLEVSITEAHLK